MRFPLTIKLASPDQAKGESCLGKDDITIFSGFAIDKSHLNEKKNWTPNVNH